LFVAQRIQSGMQHVSDLKPHERDTFKAAEALLEKLGIPLYAAVEDYVRARTLAGSESLSVMAMEYSKMFGKIVRRATVPEVVAELLRIKEQDGASVAYLGQLRTTLNRFATKFSGPILEVTGPEVDAWLRSLDIAAVTRNSMLRCIKVLFSFAKAQNYLPDEKNTAVEQMQQVRVKSEDTTIFSPEEMAKLLHHAPPDLVPILAIGAFAGIRMAELERLDWKAVDLERRFIEIRAGQAKTASRRVIPISDNLAAWLTPLERKGKIVRTRELQAHVPALARALKMNSYGNILRSFQQSLLIHGVPLTMRHSFRMLWSGAIRSRSYTPGWYALAPLGRRNVPRGQRIPAKGETLDSHPGGGGAMSGRFPASQRANAYQPMPSHPYQPH
jgi:integrase